MNKPSRGRLKKQPAPPKPVNLIDGIPDRSPHPARWKYLTLLVVFLAWVAFLVFCRIAGSP